MIRKSSQSDLDKQIDQATQDVVAADNEMKAALAVLREKQTAHAVAISAWQGLTYTRTEAAQAVEKARQKTELAKRVKQAKAEAAKPICEFLKKLEADRVECQHSGNRAGVLSLDKLISETTARRERALAVN